MLNMDIPSSINNPYAVYSEVKRENRKSNNKVNIKRRYKYKNTRLY